MLRSIQFIKQLKKKNKRNTVHKNIVLTHKINKLKILNMFYLNFSMYAYNCSVNCLMIML